MKTGGFSFPSLFIVLFCISLFFLTCQPCTASSLQESAPTSWAGAKRAFDSFMQEPSSLTSLEFYESITYGPSVNSDKTEILDYIFGLHLKDSMGRYPIIAIQMLHGDIYAARSAIRLLGFIDTDWKRPRAVTSGVLVNVGVSLGKLIRVKPELFLRACHEERECRYLKDNGWPIGFLPAIIDRLKTRASYELEMRRKALEFVGDIGLRHLRNECIGAIDRQLKNRTPESTDSESETLGYSSDPKKRIKWVFSAVNSRPSPENMKKVMALFSEVPRDNLYDIIRAMIPHSVNVERLFDLISYEAECCNEYAVEVVFSVIGIVDDIETMYVCSLISNLILMKPVLFIEKVDRFRGFLVSEDSKIPADQVIPLRYLDCICAFFSIFDYPQDCRSLILKRRIDALQALDLPEHKQLIEACIDVIKKRLANIWSYRISTIMVIEKDNSLRPTCYGRILRARPIRPSWPPAFGLPLR